MAIFCFMAVCLLVLESGTPQDDYVENFAPAAISEMQRSGVPASISLAQGILESDCGRSSLAVSANNHFGIKCHSDWKGGRFFKDDDKKNECFRVYDDASQSYRDHSDFIRSRSRYKSLFDLPVTDYRGWADGLAKAGYATDPRYAAKLVRIIEEYDLSRFDTCSAVPVAPVDAEVSADTAQFCGTVLEELSFFPGRKVSVEDGRKYIVAVKGDTFKSIAAIYGLFTCELRRFNSARRGDEPSEGDKVYISRKVKQRGI